MCSPDPRGTAQRCRQPPRTLVLAPQVRRLVAPAGRGAGGGRSIVPHGAGEDARPATARHHILAGRRVIRGVRGLGGWVQEELKSWGEAASLQGVDGSAREPNLRLMEI